MMTISTEQFDRMENLMGATIQHGPHSQRIYLMKLGEASPHDLIPRLDALATRQGYTKIFAKVPADQVRLLAANGYVQEAMIPGFYDGRQQAAFMSRFLSPARGRAADAPLLDDVLQIARAKACAADQEAPSLPAQCSIRMCTPADAEAMSQIYREVFASYPFPIHDPQFIRQTMLSHVAYFGVQFQGQWVALASAEMDSEHNNAEMTDFATLPAWRGHGLAWALLATMEMQMRKIGLKVVYTIARAVSAGMNVTFAKQGYQYAGRLVNNTHISGGIESMNVWHKPLA